MQKETENYVKMSMPPKGEEHLERVFAVIRQHKQIARVDIAELTGISAATVTTTTARLLAINLIETVSVADEETSRKAGGRGRPRQFLRLKSDSHRVMGIRLGEEEIWAVVLDYGGKLLAQGGADLSVNAGRCVDDVITEVLDLGAKVLRKAGLEYSDISSLGLALPGIVDPGMDLVHWSPLFSERSVALRHALESQLDLPVFIENDANLLALAENWFGVGQSKRDYLVVSAEGGAGLGMILGSRLYRGARGLGSVIAHVTVEPDGALCQCGRKGCLDAYLSTYGLAREMAARGENVGASLSLRAILSMRETGNENARDVVALAVRYLGIAVGNLVALFDPTDVIFSCPRPGLTQFYMEVAAAMRDQMLKVDRPETRLLTHEWNDFYWGKGAAALGLEGLTQKLLLSA